jgi:hypothetical protein
MKLTEEQIEFLDMVCNGRKYWKLNSNGEVDVDGGVFMQSMNLTEIPVKFGVVKGQFFCIDNNLTTLKNAPTLVVNNMFSCHGNNLKEYFKNIKDEDFSYWWWDWWDILKEYPFMINFTKKYLGKETFTLVLNRIPQTKIYLE